MIQIIASLAYTKSTSKYIFFKYTLIPSFLSRKKNVNTSGDVALPSHTHSYSAKSSDFFLLN